ncbi:hypothetical protein GCM10009665_38860 [Kitasatospora nipponensis]|uniref:Uncharacterized protein n=1 Tax=Kitasatospora nipponensis TaxID=258049 RepID=A0ABP4GYW0_9ACTN
MRISHHGSGTYELLPPRLPAGVSGQASGTQRASSRRSNSARAAGGAARRAAIPVGAIRLPGARDGGPGAEWTHRWARQRGKQPPNG